MADPPGSPVHIAILSDTHLPRGARRLPERCIELLDVADLIVHAGDLMRAEVLHELRSHGDVVAVHGNVDGRELQELLPARAQFRAEDAVIGVVHDAGPARGRLSRLRRQFPEAGAVIFGHSHLPLHERADDGFQIFNPGSPTERRRAPHHTMGIAHVTGSEVRFELVPLC